MNWSAFGSHEHEMTVPLGPAYVVVARCDEGCHAMKHLVSLEELEQHRYLDGLRGNLHEQIKRAFVRVHP